MVLLDVVKEEIGWEGGIGLPVANMKNKLLEKEIQEQIREISLAKSQLESQNEHVKILNSHLTNIQEQLVETQKLRQAKQLEIKSEKDYQAILKTQESRIKQEKRHLQNELENLAEKQSAHQNSVTMLEDRINLIREEIHWDRSSMDAWLEEAIRRDEDNNLLQTYANEDCSRIKELELQLEKLTLLVQNRKKTLDRKSIDFKMAQMDLDKTTAEYRSLNEQRTNYIRQWETTIEQMHQRDQEVEDYISDLMKMKDKAGQAEQRLREQERSLKERAADNRHLEQQIRAIERAQLQLKQQLADEDKKSRAAEKEVELLNKIANDANGDLNRVKTQTKQLVDTIEQHIQRTARNKEQMKLLRMNLSRASNVFAASQTEVQLMDVQMTVDRTTLNLLRKEVTEIQKNLTVDTEQLRSIDDEEKKLTREIQGLKGVERRVDVITDQLSRELYNHQQMLCVQDNEICQLEERIGRMEGSSKTKMAEQLELEDKLKSVKKVHDDKNASVQALIQETKRQQSELRTDEKEIENLKKKNCQIELQLDEVNLRNEVGQKKLKEKFAEKQKLMVDENILKLELRRFQEILTSKSANVLSMEKRRMNLETAIRERQQEIAIEKEITKTEIRMLEEAKQKMIAELNDCRTKTVKLKNRCEIMLQPVKKWNFNGEATPVHFLMKVAEEKKDLKTENEALISKVQRAEKDVTTFQRTARLLNAKNERLRKALFATPAPTAIFNFKEEKKKLDQEVAASIEKLESTKRHYNSLKELLTKQQDGLDSARAMEIETKENLGTVQQQLASIDNEIVEQEAKINRARQTLNKMVGQLMDFHDKTYSARVSDDVKLRLIIEQNRNAVASLVDFADKFPETASIIDDHFDKAQLPRPSKLRVRSLSNYNGSRSAHGSVGMLPNLGGRRSSEGTNLATNSRSVSVSSTTLPSVVSLNIPAGSMGKNFKQATARSLSTK